MSFAATQLSVLAYANGFTHWHYRTPDPLDLVLLPGYFAAAAEMLRPGDQLTVNLLHEQHVDIAQLVVARLAGADVALALVAASRTPPAAMSRAA